MKTEKKIIDKRYEDKHKDERKAAHAVWGDVHEQSGL